MSVSKWAYEPSKCDGKACVGDCDLCKLADGDEEDEEYEQKRQELNEVATWFREHAQRVGEKHDGIVVLFYEYEDDNVEAHAIGGDVTLLAMLTNAMEKISEDMSEDTKEHAHGMEN